MAFRPCLSLKRLVSTEQVKLNWHIHSVCKYSYRLKKAAPIAKQVNLSIVHLLSLRPTFFFFVYKAYIDTEGTFRPDRISAIADRYGVDPDIVLDNIVVARVWNSDQQMELISELAAHFAEQRGAYRLLVIDSIISLFRCDYSGRGELADRQQKLNQMLNRLQKISEEYNIAVFMTNQVSSDPGGNGSCQAV